MNTTKSIITIFIFAVVFVSSITLNIAQYKKNNNNESNSITIIDTLYQNTISTDTIYVNVEKTVIDTFSISDTIFIYTENDTIGIKQLYNKTYKDTFKFSDSITDSLSKFDISMNINHFSKISLSLNSIKQLKLTNKSHFEIENLILNTTIVNKQVVPVLTKKEKKLHHLFIHSDFGIRMNYTEELYLLKPSIGLIYNWSRYLIGVNVGQSRITINTGFRLF